MGSRTGSKTGAAAGATGAPGERGRNGRWVAAIFVAGIAISVAFLVFTGRRATPPASPEATTVDERPVSTTVPPELEAAADEAERLRAAIRESPNDPMLKLELAQVLIALDREPEAGQLVIEAHRVAPDDPRVVYNFAMYRIAKHRWDAAESALVRLLELEPGHGAGRRALESVRQARETEAAGE